MPSTWVKVLLRATPVTMPGRAIGRITRKEIVSRPKKRWRATASAARVPSSERDRGRDEAGLDRGEQGFAGGFAFERLA